MGEGKIIYGKIAAAFVRMCAVLCLSPPSSELTGQKWKLTSVKEVKHGYEVFKCK